MMLAHPQIDTVIDFEVGKVPTMVIENPGFLREFLRDIANQIEGGSGKTFLSENNALLPFSKHADLIDNVLSFSLNRKPLLTKLMARLESGAVGETNYVRTAELMGQLEQLILELSFDLPCDVFCSKMSIGGVLRSAGIEIADDYDNDLERFLDYMELTRELDKDRLFIFVGLRSYYSDEDMQQFMDSVLSHDFRALLVDSISRPRLLKEARVTVDIDLCEF